MAAFEDVCGQCRYAVFDYHPHVLSFTWGKETMSIHSNHPGANNRFFAIHSEYKSKEHNGKWKLPLNCLIGFTLVLLMLMLCQPSALSNGGIIRVAPGEDLQAKIDEAPDGATILLQAGEYYGGPLCLHIHKSITIRSDAQFEDLDNIVGIGIDDARGWLNIGLAIEADTVRFNGIVYVDGGAVNLLGVEIYAGEISVGVTVKRGRLFMKHCLINSGASGVHLMNSSRATIQDSAIILNKSLGILVDADAHVEITNTYIGRNGSDGIRLVGEATISGSLIAQNGVSLDSEKKVVVTESGDGIEVLRGARLELRRSWIIGNGGSGINFYALGYEDEWTPHVTGGENVIPDLYEADANLQGAVLPSLDDLSEEQARLCWPATFLAMTHARPTEFKWRYYGKDYVLKTVLDIPVGGFTCDWDVSREGGEPLTAQDAFTHFTNVTSLAPVVDQLVDFAKADGYHGLALADFILQFVLQNTSYDVKRWKESRPSGYLAPTVTLAKGRGVCRDTAVLTSVLLKLAGFDCLLVSLEPADPEDDGHMVVAVDVKGAWGHYVEYKGKRFYLVDTTAVCDHIGEYSIKDWAKSTLIDVQFAPNLVAYISFFDLPTISESGNLGELHISNRGDSPSSEASVQLHVDDAPTSDSATALSWHVGALQPGEEHVFIVPNDGIISSQTIETWPEHRSDFPILDILIKTTTSTNHFFSLFLPGYSMPRCP